MSTIYWDYDRKELNQVKPFLTALKEFNQVKPFLTVLLQTKSGGQITPQQICDSLKKPAVVKVQMETESTHLLGQAKKKKKHPDSYLFQYKFTQQLLSAERMEQKF